MKDGARSLAGISERLSTRAGPCSWADDFARLQLHSRPGPEGWAADFAQRQQQQHQNGVAGRSRSWGQIWDEGAAESSDWASDFAAKAQAATVRLCPHPQADILLQDPL